MNLKTVEDIIEIGQRLTKAETELVAARNEIKRLTDLNNRLIDKIVPVQPEQRKTDD